MLSIDTFANNHATKGSTIHSDGANGYDNLEAFYNSIQGTIQKLMLEKVENVQIKQKVIFQDLEDYNMVNVINYQINI